MNDDQIFATFFASWGLAILAIAVLTLIAMWKIFVKAGEKGWKCLIPIYDMHVFARICWKSSYFWYSVLISGVLAGVGTAIGGTFGLCIGIVGSLVELAYLILSMKHLSIRFGKTTGFTVLLVLLNTIGLLILGWGPADYQMIRDTDTKL